MQSILPVFHASAYLQEYIPYIYFTLKYSDVNGQICFYNGQTKSTSKEYGTTKIINVYENYK